MKQLEAKHLQQAALKHGVALDTGQAWEAANACDNITTLATVAVQLAAVGAVGNPCLGGFNVFFSGGDALEATQHDYDAILGRNYFGPANEIIANPTKPAVVHRKYPPWRRGWINTPRDALGNRVCPTPRGIDESGQNRQCDEYPFASMQEGGNPRDASRRFGDGGRLRMIRADQNEEQGYLIQKEFYGPCGIQDTSPPFLFVPVPVPGVPSFGKCGND